MVKTLYKIKFILHAFKHWLSWWLLLSDLTKPFRTDQSLSWYFFLFPFSLARPWLRLFRWWVSFSYSESWLNAGTCNLWFLNWYLNVGLNDIWYYATNRISIMIESIYFGLFYVTISNMWHLLHTLDCLILFTFFVWLSYSIKFVFVIVYFVFL